MYFKKYAFKNIDRGAVRFFSNRLDKDLTIFSEHSHN